jgi:hypothetical protein
MQVIYVRLLVYFVCRDVNRIYWEMREFICVNETKSRYYFKFSHLTVSNNVKNMLNKFLYNRLYTTAS